MVSQEQRSSLNAHDVAAGVRRRAGTARSLAATPPLVERGWSPRHLCERFAGFSCHAALLAGIKARTKETRLAVADVAVAAVAGACVGGSTELNPWDSPISQLRLVTGAGAGPRSSVRTRCKGETRLTDLIQS